MLHIKLNDISTGIGVSETFIGDLGLNQSPARSTMSNGNKNGIGKFLNRCIIGF